MASHLCFIAATALLLGIEATKPGKPLLSLAFITAEVNV